MLHFKYDAMNLFVIYTNAIHDSVSCFQRRQQKCHAMYQHQMELWMEGKFAEITNIINGKIY